MSIPTTIIIGINSDIGTGLAQRFIKDEHRVVGTFRNKRSDVNCLQFKADLDFIVSSSNLLNWLYDSGTHWDNLIFCVGNPLPLKKFTESHIQGEWRKSLDVNGLHQLSLFQDLFPFRSEKPSVCFLSAGGVNSCPTNFSAYTLGKTLLVKACELIAAEEPGLNIFTYGPGWVNTKTHDQMASALPEGERKAAIEKFRQSNKTFEEDIDEIYKDLRLLQSKNSSSGRNFTRGDKCFDRKYQQYWHTFEVHSLLKDSGYKLRIQK
jgi:NAD(P)-dependent dehydrogenase (short-subunit alcohol dehydrogenase family)